MTQMTCRSSNAAGAWQELLLQLVWAVTAAAGLPSMAAADGAHAQVMASMMVLAAHMSMATLLLLTTNSPTLMLISSALQALHGHGDVYQEDFWSRQFTSTCAAAALKCKGAASRRVISIRTAIHI